MKSWGDYCVYLSFWEKVAASFWRVEDVVVCVADHRWLRHVANSLLWNGFLCGENSILCGWSAPNLETFKTRTCFYPRGKSDSFYLKIFKWGSFRLHICSCFKFREPLFTISPPLTLMERAHMSKNFNTKSFGFEPHLHVTYMSFSVFKRERKFPLALTCLQLLI